MLFYSLKRLGLAILVALTVSMISFSLLYISSDPAIAMAGETASDADIEAIRQLYGFDRPIVVQYLDWLQKAVNGDLWVKRDYLCHCCGGAFGGCCRDPAKQYH